MTRSEQGQVLDLARLVRSASKCSFSSTAWHDEMVRLMAQEAGVSQSLVLRTAIEFLSTNFDVAFSPRGGDGEQAVSGLLFLTKTQLDPGEPVDAGGGGWVLNFVEGD